MEADWELEIAPDAPVIDAEWAGLVDLRMNPKGATGLPEAQQFEALGSILQRLNGWSGSPLEHSEGLFCTSKCDVWTPEVLDPYELEAQPAEAICSRACYVDLIPAKNALFSSIPALQSQASRFISTLRRISLSRSRVDLILRRAVKGDSPGFAITAYVTACGATPSDADDTLASALNAFADAISSAGP